MPTTIAIVKNWLSANFTSVFAKKHNFAHFDIYYASKNWEVNVVQSSGDRCSKLPL